MTARFKSLTAFLALVAAIVFFYTGSARASDVTAGSPNKFIGWWELGGYYGTDDSSRGEIVLFTPLMQSATTLFFLDARGKLFEEDVQEANIALGYRQMMPSGWNFGIWGGWDIRDTTNDNTFNQISFGLEALSERYDLRVNGYVPIEDDETVSNTTTFAALLQGNNIFVQQTDTLIRELAYYGVDAEFGVLLFGGARGGTAGGFKDGLAPSRRHELRAYAGGFWFDHDDADDEIAGPKGRLEYRINDAIASLPGSRLTIESELSYDDVRETRFEIGARLRIPFGSRGADAALRTASLTPQELRMTDGLERDTDIVTNEQTDITTATEGAIDDATDVALNSVSFATNANQLGDAVNAGGNRLIIVQRNGAQIDLSGTDGQILQDNQTVQGGGSTILIRGKNSGQVVPFTAPGNTPTLFSNDTNPDTGVFNVANNTHIAGLNIVGDPGVGADNHGIRGRDNLTNIVIENNTITDTGEDAVFFDDDNSNVRIIDNTLTDIGGDGVHFQQQNANITIARNIMTNLGSNGAFLQDRDNVNVVISDNVLTNTQVGVFLGSNNGNTNVTISNNTIVDTRDDAIFINDNNTNLTISGNTINGTANVGIIISAGNTNVLLADNTLTNIGNGGANDDAFFFDAAGTTLAAGSTGNQVTTAPNAGVICRGTGNFAGILEVTDQNGTLLSFENVDACN